MLLPFQMSVTMSEELSSGVSDTGDFSPAAASDTLVKQPYVPPQSLPGYTPPPRTETYLQTGNVLIIYQHLNK